MIGEQHLAHDQMGTPNHKPPTRVRWTPSQIQFQILERLFEQDNGTPNKQHLKEIADELRQHGQIAETNVYNWFQNRKARAKRRHQQVAWRCRTHLNQAKGAQQVSMKNGDSEVDTDADSPRQKQPRHDRELTQNNSENFAHVKRISFDQGNRSGNEQSPGQIDHHEWQQVTVSSVLVEEDDIKPKIPFIAGGFDPHGFAQGATVSSTVKIGDSSKPLHAAQDVNDEDTLPGDSKAQIIPTSEGSPSLHPIQIEESYSLAGGPVPSMAESQKWPEKGLKEVLGVGPHLLESSLSDVS